MSLRDPVPKKLASLYIAEILIPVGGFVAFVSDSAPLVVLSVVGWFAVCLMIIRYHKQNPGQ